ncbi:unnamed protein product, partial [Sphenostylis stenocarpa]
TKTKLARGCHFSLPFSEHKATFGIHPSTVTFLSSFVGPYAHFKPYHNPPSHVHKLISDHA